MTLPPAAFQILQSYCCTVVTNTNSTKLRLYHSFSLPIMGIGKSVLMCFIPPAHGQIELSAQGRLCLRIKSAECGFQNS